VKLIHKKNISTSVPEMEQVRHETQNVFDNNWLAEMELWEQLDLFVYFVVMPETIMSHLRVRNDNLLI
jgi:hypothetical protein